MTLEGKVKERVKKLLKAHGAYWHMPVQNGMGAPSLDFVCCYDGKYFGIETKSGNKQMTPRQELTAKAILAAGGEVFLVNEEVGMDKLESWLNGGVV